MEALPILSPDLGRYNSLAICATPPPCGGVQLVPGDVP